MSVSSEIILIPGCRRLRQPGFFYAFRFAAYNISGLSYFTYPLKQKPEFAEFVSPPDGFRVAVGRNNLQHDELTYKVAGRRDIWFQVQKAQGSHVVLFTDGAAPGPEDMEFAASLAVRFSSKRGGSAEVDYTEVANLKKPGGARPGFVIYHVYNSMRSGG